jgi:hypothetical protein
LRLFEFQVCYFSFKLLRLNDRPVNAQKIIILILPKNQFDSGIATFCHHSKL